MAVRRRQIRAIAERLLTTHGVHQAPIRVDALARRLGIEIRRQPTGTDFSGFLMRDPTRRRSTIGVNSRHSATRQRFTIAHELGHYLLHEGDALHVDRDHIFRVSLRDTRSSQGVDVVEKEANLFAAELLMPAQLLAADVGKRSAIGLSDEDIRSLAKQYAVSSQALMFRLAYLGFVQP